MKKSQHVVPDSAGGWKVVKGGADKATKKFDTKKPAVNYARQLSAKQNAELFVHKKDGTIERRDTHPRDHKLPKDKDTHK